MCAMKRTHLPDRLQAVLKRIPCVTIATVREDGKPWNTPIVGHFDDDLNLYFITAKNSQHGRNIDRCPDIFVVVYDTEAPLGTGEGLYMQMRAAVLQTPAAITQARKAAGLHFSERIPGHADFLGDCPRRFYKATLERIWSNTTESHDGHELDVRLALTEPEYTDSVTQAL